jgi:hypothetical protein
MSSEERYYHSKNTYYIQIENIGLFHTGEDILALDVPFFSCKTKLRIRSTKHKKNGIPTDITAAMQFDRKSLIKSLYNFETNLPSKFTRKNNNL